MAIENEVYTFTSRLTRIPYALVMTSQSTLCVIHGTINCDVITIISDVYSSFIPNKTTFTKYYFT